MNTFMFTHFFFSLNPNWACLVHTMNWQLDAVVKLGRRHTDTDSANTCPQSKRTGFNKQRKNVG